MVNKDEYITTFTLFTATPCAVIHAVTGWAVNVTRHRVVADFLRVHYIRLDLHVPTFHDYKWTIEVAKTGSKIIAVWIVINRCVILSLNVRSFWNFWSPVLLMRTDKSSSLNCLKWCYVCADYQHVPGELSWSVRKNQEPFPAQPRQNAGSREVNIFYSK